MHELYQRLKVAFNLTDKHIQILMVLEKEKLTAKQVSVATDIPYGRIYGYLNELLNYELIEKTPKKPYTYYVVNMKENIVGFMRGKIGEQIKAQTEIIHMLSTTKGSEHIELVKNADEFTQSHINMLSEAKAFKMIGVHNSFPYILYPDNFEDFLALRKMIRKYRPTITDSNLDTTLLIYRAYMDALKKGKKMAVIFEKDTFERHMKLIKDKLGKEFLRKLILGNLEKLKKYKADVYVMDEYTIMQIDLNENRVILCLKYLGMVNGIMILNGDVINFFNSVFEQKQKGALSVVPLFKKMLKEL